MASSPASRSSQLTPLQTAVLGAFFARERGFFLTGGAALGGFHLCHRPTDDLDLFTTDEAAYQRARHALQDVADDVGAALVVRQDTPRFRRVVLTRGDEALVVDLVRDGVQALPKLDVGDIILDSPAEILVNKLGALVGRAEERDLVDVMFLEESGLRVEDALPMALAKDGGCTPATLAWLLAETEIPDGVVLPAGVAPATLRAYAAALVVRLRRAALPTP